MTDLSKLQLNAVLSALDGQPRNPNTKDATLRRTCAHAERLGISLDALLAAAAGLLDGRMSAEQFRTCLQDDAAEAAGRIEPIEEAAASGTPGRRPSARGVNWAEPATAADGGAPLPPEPPGSVRNRPRRNLPQGPQASRRHRRRADRHAAPARGRHHRQIIGSHTPSAAPSPAR
jgi:hypothetical protein